jgi:hypothetical protein
MNPGYEVPKALLAALRNARLTWSSLINGATEVVLFGSRAAMVASESSDWDILCVGTGLAQSLHPAVDIVWVSPDSVCRDVWLGSELAGHVGSYGRWLVGDGAWRASTFVSECSVARKTRRIQMHLAGMDSVWASLTAPYRSSMFTSLRHEAQRLEILGRREAVPPKAILEQSWAKDRIERTNVQRRLLGLFSRGAGVSLTEPFAEELLTWIHELVEPCP